MQAILHQLKLQRFDTAQKPLADIVRHHNRNQYALDAQGQLLGLHLSGEQHASKLIEQLLQSPQAVTLQYLRLSETALTSLQLPRFAQLKALNLSENSNLRTLSFAATLPQLQSLHLYGCTKLGSVALPAGCNALQTFVAYDTALTDVLLQGNCPQLRRVELHNNENLQNLQMPSNLTNLEAVYLDESDRLKNIPPEILNQGAAGVAVYFKEIAEQGTAKLYEAKVLILGEGGAGKTTLLRKLTRGIHAAMPTEGESTKGIDILPHPFICQDADGKQHDFVMHLWDFGGQEIYHATHQFFLTKRSLYILVTDERKEDTDFNYWLQVVELLSDNSPLIIVQNERHGRKRDINIARLKGRFSNIQTTHSFDLSKDKSALDRLLQDIKHQLNQLPHIGEDLPKNWVNIRDELSQLKSQNPYISRKEYLDICRKNSVEGEIAKTLGNTLHELGAFLYFQDDSTLKHYIFLENEWATNGVYDILDHADIKNANGHFNKKMAATIWQSRKYCDMHDELLALMARFELCYEIPDKKGHFIAPQLLSVQDPPSATQWDNTNNLQLRYEYEFMPKGILSRLMVRLHRHIDNAQNDAWKTGVIFTRKGAQVKVLETYDVRNLHLSGKGVQVKELMTIIADEIDALNSTYPNLKLKKWIPCICTQCANNSEPHFYDYENVQRRKHNNRQKIECDESYEEVAIEQLIDNIFTQQVFDRLSKPIDKTIHQAITLSTQQNFAQAFALLDTLHLQNPLYYQLKREYTSGVYRNDPHYADRLITFMNSL